MKVKRYSIESNSTFIVFLISLMTLGLTSVYGQCPTVTNPNQSFCDLESLLVSDLQAIDNGGGITWYDTATSTTPLSPSDGLVDGQDYYADDNTGTCGARARVDVIIYGPPVGQNFQGVCFDDPSLATVADLVALGNDVQWYLTASGGTPLNGSDILIDDTIYYADQANPDSGCRTSRLSVLVNVGLTPIPTGDAIQEFCFNSQITPTIADLVASGMNNWYISLASALPLSETTPLVNGQTYYASTLDPPCESSGRLAVTVTLTAGPDPGASGTLDLCDNDTMTFDLFDSLGGMPETGGTWSPTLDSGTGVFDPSIDPPGTYTYTVSSVNTCPDASSTVIVTISPQPDAGTSSTLDLCSDSGPIDLFASLGGTPEAGGTWSPLLASGTGIFDPSLDSEGIYTYTILGTPPCTASSATVTVSVELFKDAGEDGAVDICNDGSTIDLFNSLGGTPDTGGIWSPTLASGTGIFDPSVDAEGIYTYSFSGNAPCPDDSATVTVTVNEIPNAGTSASLDLCSNNTSTIDLFDSLGGTPETGGTWSPTLSSGTGIFDPAVDPAGIYTYTVTGAPPCTDASSTVTVSIIAEPNAGLDANLDLCSNDSAIDLFNILGGTPDAGGVWTPTLSSGTGIFDPLVDSEGSYTYTVLGTPPCTDVSAIVTISIIPFLNAGTNGSLQLCSDDAPVDLFDSLGGTPDTGGTWSPMLASGTGIFDPTIDTAGAYTYMTTATGPCVSDSATVSVSIETAPDAGTDGNLEICNTSNTVDLFNSLGGTPDISGTWTPALASGTGIFDPNTDAAGIYTYTVSSLLCDDSTSTVTVLIADPISAGENGFLDICDTDAPVDLFNSLGGSPDTGGTWSPALTSGTGIFDPSVDLSGTYTYTVTSNLASCPSASATVTVSVLEEPNSGTDGTLNLCGATNNTDLFDSLGGTPDSGGTWSPVLSSGTGIFNPNTDPEGIYTYTVTNICSTNSATVTVSFTNLNDAGDNGALDICINNVSVDLFDSLGGTPQPGGIWSPTLNSGTGIFDPSIDEGGIYTYTISNSASDCPADSAIVTVTIVDEPDAGGDSTLNLCGSTNNVDLFDSLSGTPDLGGTWSPALASGTGIFNPNVDSEGIYTYTITNICGTSSATVTVSFSGVNDAGTDGTLDICSNDTPVDLFDSLGGTPQAGGSWSPVLNSGTGIFDPNIDSGGIYTYTVSNSASDCPAASANVTVTVIPPPNAGTDATLDICVDDTTIIDLFDSLGGTPDSGGTWSPALASGTGIFDPNVDTAGIYTYTVNSTICNLTDDASVTVAIGNVPNAIGLNMSIDGITCFGEDITVNINGANQLADGDYDIVYELSGDNVDTNSITITITGGSASFTIPASSLQNTGSTILRITELYFVGEFCSADTTVISPIEIFILDIATPQITSDGGDFCEFDDPTVADLTANITSSGAIIWYDSPTGGTIYSETDALEDGVTYYASLSSESGCESTIRLAITVTFIDCVLELIIPDGFSPNGDTINDDFHIVNLNELYPNFKLTIYNRYGNVLYEGDISSERWNGTSRKSDKVVPVGVYFYILEFNDGTRKPLQGRVYLNR
ncbi:gliding motility-associated C-terminal domain-containing protein [Winogradskyella flava]|uniref:Gliding motility-associated C-terminal domain-containing protein n=1 Tax=Winogradskyella flava TaxID=1884876 RepID=A0A842IPY6_9FLAO|nr:gliding motility-associated C-terminal domain-containing protein [Winogradskyella flava]MBC2844755.1 gliding motility-associated C-terminal domain-containing protein [Winogradskyella flava]